MNNTYILKPMAIARMAAESTALLMLILLPIIILLVGKYPLLPLTGKIILPLVALLSAFILPAYGFTTFKVQLSDTGIGTVSLFQKQFMDWNNITQVSMKSSLGFRRYVITGKDKETLALPLLLKNLKELINIIRSRLPNMGRRGKGQDRIFSQSFLSVFIQFCQLGIAYAFTILFWIFYLSLSHNSFLPSSSDQTIILTACVALTIIIVCRTFLIILMPISIVLVANSLKLKTCFVEKTISIEQLKRVYQNLFLLPEGLVARTNAGLFYISSYLTDFDELEEELLSKQKA